MRSKVAVLLSREFKQDGMYDYSGAVKLAAALKGYGLDVCVISSREVKDRTFDDVQVYAAPESSDTLPKLSNWAVECHKHQQDHCKFLHVVPDSAELTADPTKFIEALERMMLHLKLTSWLSTACDPMNYVYQKYNPRMKVVLDGDDAAAAGASELVFTSNANTTWMCFDLDADVEKLKFSEDFTIPMYYIIEFLARRRAASDGLDFMNMYPTVPEEQGVFKLAISGSQPEESLMKAEYEKFSSLGLDLAPTTIVDQVLERLYNTISQKDKKEE